MEYGYGRVSRDKQSLDRQEDLFRRLGIDPKHVFMEKMTGTIANRPQLERLKEEVRDGDTIHIESLSRLGRSTKDLLTLIEYFQDKGVTIISAKESIDISTATGQLFTTLLCALAEFERSLIIERTQEGLMSARARGRKGGRPPKKEQDIKIALSLYDSRDYSIKEICVRCGISGGTLFKYINRRNAEMAKEQHKESRDGTC